MSAPRHASRTDGNQTSIFAALRQVGAVCLDLHKVGHDCPDSLILFRGKLTLCEIKNPDGYNRVSEGQQRFIDGWQGTAVIVRSVSDALRAIGLEVVGA